MSALTLLHPWYRTYQLAFGLGARLLPWRRPEAVTGAGSFRRLPDLLQKYGARRPLVVASRRQCAAPVFRQVLDRLEGYALYTGVTPNPPVAEAEAIAAFLHQTGMTQEAVAAQLGMSPSALANKLRLLRLSPACRALLVEHGLTERHARCLLRLEDEGERLTALRQAAAKHWNVAQTEQYVERRLAALQTAPPAGRRTYIIKDVRLFLNSVDRGLRLIRDAGVDARTEREETEDEIVLTLRIPKQRRKEA